MWWWQAVLALPRLAMSRPNFRMGWSDSICGFCVLCEMNYINLVACSNPSGPGWWMTTGQSSAGCHSPKPNLSDWKAVCMSWQSCLLVLLLVFSWYGPCKESNRSYRGSKWQRAAKLWYLWSSNCRGVPAKRKPAEKHHATSDKTFKTPIFFRVSQLQSRVRNT